MDMIATWCGVVLLLGITTVLLAGMAWAFSKIIDDL